MTNSTSITASPDCPGKSLCQGSLVQRLLVYNKTSQLEKQLYLLLKRTLAYSVYFKDVDLNLLSKVKITPLRLPLLRKPLDNRFSMF